jgi:hypothetical protein
MSTPTPGSWPGPCRSSFTGGGWHDQATAQQAAVTAARRLTDPPVQARAHRSLALAYIGLGRHDDAHIHLRHALDLTTQAGGQVGQAHTHQTLVMVWGGRDAMLRPFTTPGRPSTCSGPPATGRDRPTPSKPGRMGANQSVP